MNVELRVRKKCISLLVIVSLTSIIVVSSCQDTCNSVSTFSEVKGNLLISDSTELILEILWKEKTNLPLQYYKDIKINTDETYGHILIHPNKKNDWKLIDSISIKKSGTMLIYLNETIRNHLSSPVDFCLFFPDRINYIACSHPGSPSDRYYLDLSFVINISKNNQKELNKFLWKEDLVKGGF